MNDPIIVLSAIIFTAIVLIAISLDLYGVL
jgi:hypothetical protein